MESAKGSTRSENVVGTVAANQATRIEQTAALLPTKLKWAIMVIYDDHMARKKLVFNVAEAKAHFSTLVRRATGGEEIVIARGNKPLVKLVALSDPAKMRKPGSAKGRVRLAADFDRTPLDFKDYL
jgi:prevent-host-death family protein